ncbi:hypothetical protein D3C84_301160 [compost metagenome]
MGGIGPEADAGAMGRGGNRPGQGLVVDVGHVVQRLADALEGRAHERHRRAGGELRLQGAGVVLEQAVEVAERDQGAIGGHQGAEGVGRAHRADLAFRPADDLDQLIQALWRQPRHRQAVLRAGPVAPGHQAWGADQLRHRRGAGKCGERADDAGALQQLASGEVYSHS